MKNDFFVVSDLPEILNQEELTYYFKKYKEGDKTCRDILIKHNIRLVISRVIKKFSNTVYDKKELISIGLIGLIKSVDTFDLEKKVNFATYSLRCIDNEILMFLRKEKKHLLDDSLDKVLATNKEGRELKIEDTLYDLNSNFVENYLKKETYQILREMILNLSNKEREIVQLYFGFLNESPKSQKEIASLLKISQSYVSRIITKIIKQLKEQLKEMETIEIKSDNSKEKLLKL